MKAERVYHVERDQLVSPRRILNTTAGARIEKQGQAAGQEGERQEKEGERQEKEGERQENHNAPSHASLPRAVLAVGGTLGEGQGKHDALNTDVLPRAVLSVGESSGGTEERKEQRLAGEEQVVDQHPEKGLISGSSKDGLGEEMATKDMDEGRIEEGEEARAPKRLPAPVFVSKAEGRT